MKVGASPYVRYQGGIKAKAPLWYMKVLASSHFQPCGVTVNLVQYPLAEHTKATNPTGGSVRKEGFNIHV